MENNKLKRTHGTHRWSEQQTSELLTLVVEAVKSNPESFEKPTAQKFYEKISGTSACLATVKWDVMRTKMRHMKTGYMAAIKWQGQTGAGLTENGDEKSVKEHVQKLCPNIKYLEEIFGQRVNVHPPVIYQSSQSVPVEQSLEIEVIDFNADVHAFTLSPENSAPNSPEPACSQSAPTTPVCNNSSVSAKKSKQPYNSNPFFMLFEMQKKKLEVEVQKLELEKTKEANNFKLKLLELEMKERIEMEKIRVERLDKLDPSQKTA